MSACGTIEEATTTAEKEFEPGYTITQVFVDGPKKNTKVWLVEGKLKRKYLKRFYK